MHLLPHREALAIAAQDGHLDAVKELLSRGADFNGKQVRLDRLHNQTVPACMAFMQECMDIAACLLWELAACSCHLLTWCLHHKLFLSWSVMHVCGCIVQLQSAM